MANRLPTAQDLGVVQINPSLGVVQSRGDTGLEGVEGRMFAQAGNEFGEAAAYLQKAQDEQDRMAAEDALNKYRSDLLRRQHDEKDGWQGQLGEAATNPENIKRHLEYMQRSRDQIGQTLSARAKRYFQPQAEASRMHAEASFFGHVSTQRTAQEVKIFEAGQQLIMDEVSRSPFGAAGDDLMRARIEEANAKTQAFALRRGFSKEEAVALSNDAITRIVATRIESALNANRADEAKRIYDENEKLLGQKGRQMAGKVNDAYLKHETFNIADRVANEIQAGVEAKNQDKGIMPGGSDPAPAAPAPQNPFQNVQGGSSSSAVVSERGTRLPNPSLVKFTPQEEATIVQASGGNVDKQSFMRNVVAVENAGFGRVRHDKVSPAKAAGGFQIWEPTARALGLDPKDRADFGKSAAAVSKLYDELHARYKGNRMAMAADYNGGTVAGEAVMRGLQPPREETRNYLKMFAQAEGVEPSGPATPQQNKVGPATPQQNKVIFQTSRVRDLREELRTAEDRVTAEYTKKFGASNPEGLELARQRVRSRLAVMIQQEEGIQQGNLNEITTQILNNGIDNFADLQRLPGMADKLRTAGPYMQHITSLMNMVGAERSGAKLKGDASLFFDLTRRVVGGEITNDKDLLPYLMDPNRPGKGLDMQQFNSLQQQIARVQRPETRDHEKTLHFISQSVQRNMYFVAAQQGVYIDPDGKSGAVANVMYNDAIAAWNIDVREEIRTAAPERLAKLFDRNSPEYIGSMDRLARYFRQVRDRESPPASRPIKPTLEERRTSPLPVIKGDWRTSRAHKELPEAVLTPEGWKGGWFIWQGKEYQKYPTTTGSTGG